MTSDDARPPAETPDAEDSPRRGRPVGGPAIGAHVAGPDVAGSDVTGSDAPGSDARTPDVAGVQVAGAHAAGKRGVGRHAAGKEVGGRLASGGRRASWPTVLGVLLLVTGLSILGWIGWEFWGTNAQSHHEANSVTQALEKSWQQTKGPKVTPATLPVKPGEAFAIMRIPRLGSDWRYPVIDGTTPDVLARGVGWYSNTAKPGAVGNFAVAAHRVTHGEPFRHLLTLRVGDQVIVQTRDHTYTYVIDRPPSELTVEDTDTWVIDPVPGHPGQKPTRALLTLTTCAELFHTSKRSVAFGHLVSST